MTSLRRAGARSLLIGAFLVPTLVAAPAAGRLPGDLGAVAHGLATVVPDPPVGLPQPPVEIPPLPSLPEGAPPSPAPTITPPGRATPLPQPGGPMVPQSTIHPGSKRTGLRPRAPDARPRASRVPTPAPAAGRGPAARGAVPDRGQPARVGGTVVPPAPARSPVVQEEGGPAIGFAGDIIAALPPDVLWALIGTAALAAGLAGNAYWQSRQRKLLEAQRAELLDDVGLLSLALLPAVPDGIEGLLVSAAYRPADGPAAGGDFYDVFPLEHNRTGVLLGDVSGHGRSSVTHAALARYTLRTLLAAGHAPGEALAHADRLLARDLPPHFVTVIAAVYDESTAELTYAKAGHAPPIVLGTAHDPDAEEPACPIGLGLGTSWPEFRLHLCEDVAVCLYTDGLEDARLDGTRIGRSRVVGLLAAQDRPDATQLLSDLGELADQMSDDTAAVVLRGVR